MKREKEGGEKLFEGVSAIGNGGGLDDGPNEAPAPAANPGESEGNCGGLENEGGPYCPLELFMNAGPF